MDLCLNYGDAGTDLITDVEFQLDKPKITDVDSSGVPIYQLAYHAGRGVLGDPDFIAERWDPDHTHAFEMRFHHHHLNLESKITEYKKKKKGGLLQVLLALLSKSSYEALDNLPAFSISKAKRNTRTLWRLYKQVHLRSFASVN